jgi:outer membrane lipoprotein carrier protein
MIRTLLATALLLSACGLRPRRRRRHAQGLRRAVKTGQAGLHATGHLARRRKKKTSSGTFDFARPDRFRFAYTKPYQQLIVSDGQKVVDPRRRPQPGDGAQVLAGARRHAGRGAGRRLTRRRTSTSPALPAKDGLEWAEAKPKAKDGAFQSVRIGFKGRDLAAIEITDSFGSARCCSSPSSCPTRRSGPTASRFVVPKGADVIEQ